MQSNLIKEIPKGLLGWYQFNNEDNILLVGSECPELGELFEQLHKQQKIADFAWVKNDVELNRRGSDATYSVIVSVKTMETQKDPVAFLKCLRPFLKPQGRLLLGVNNRFGIRYFCGDRDPYTGRNFDGIENYRRCAVKKEDVLDGRMYSWEELHCILEEAGIKTQKYFSVFPDLEQPSFVFSEKFMPNEELNIRVFPMYNSPDTVFLEEEYLYTDLIKNGMFHKMANAFLIEGYVENSIHGSDVLHVTMSLDRGREDALYTIIHENEWVEKKAVYPEGVLRLQQLFLHMEDLEAHQLSVVHGEISGDSYRMPFIKAETALEYLRRLSQMNEDVFVEAMDEFYNCILQSSENYLVSVNGKDIVYLKNGYLDLIPLNCFRKDTSYLFYDQEFCMPDCPIGVVIVRFIDIVYSGDYKLQQVLPREYFYNRYGILEDAEMYRRTANDFLRTLRKEKELRLYHEKYRRNPEIVNANRQRMNYSEEEYLRKFVDIFRNLGDRKLILFGSGAFTKRFIAMYGKSYEIAYILDNNESRWGQQLDGYEIKPPAYLQEISKEEYKVLICIKNYLSVAKQLETMGITDYGIFDTSRSYVKPVYRRESIDPKTDSGANTKSDDVKKIEKKKYHIGYVAGVFDMFHTGHVRLLQRAKELCDYLIVGVVSDEDCYRQKNKYPVISCEDRVEVIKACRYADQVEALPTGFGGIRDAYKMFQFDVQFSGDDHGEDGGWLAEKEYLNKHGADLVFFDYTKGISSTEIRKKLER